MGAHVVQVIGGEGANVVRYGGEARFMTGAALNAEGYYSGWEAEYARLLELVSFDGEGWPRAADGGTLEGAALNALPPRLQLECRARIALGEVLVRQFDDGAKHCETHVNLEVQRHNHLRFCEWQAKLRITVAYSLDATHTVARDTEGAPLRDDEGNVAHVDARAAVRHDGVVFGGVLEVHEGGKHYTGECCALTLTRLKMRRGA